MDFKNRILNWKNLAWLPGLLALFGGLVYLWQSILLAHTTVSNLDEGAYLYKGLLFAEGIYRPFQPYGALTNKAPLAFLIPGYFQVLFEPGLRAGRYLAVLEGVLAVLGVWIVTNRMSTKWIAAGTVWVMATSTAVIKVYSVGATQSLMACLLAWILVFSLGENRPLWQLILSALLASISILARQNMILVLPILLLYIFWQHGWRAGSWSSIFGVGLFVLGHAVYWPEILQIWVGWLPVFPTEWAAYNEPVSTNSIWNPQVLVLGRLLSVFQGFRWHFIILSGSLFTFLFLSKTEKWWLSVRYRAMIFLGALFFSLLFLHSYASIEQDYCVFCFAPYLSFFSVVGLVFIAIAIPTWKTEIPTILQIGCALIVLIISSGVGFATFEDTGHWLTTLPFPRISNGEFLPGFNTVGEVLANKFSFDQGMSRRISALGAGAMIGLLVIGLVFLINVFYLKQKRQYAYMLVNTFLVLGFILSPILQGSQGAADCRQDVIASNEINGEYLREILPANSSVYWDGGLSVAPLLYVPQARIYPPQINDGYAYREGGNADEMLKFGYWNAELASRWRDEADIIIIEEWRYQDWQSFLTPDKFAEFPRTPESTSCLDGTRLRIFKRN